MVIKLSPYKISPTGETRLVLPAGAEILSVYAVDTDMGLEGFLTIMGDPSAPLMERRCIGLRAWSELPNQPLRFIGTLQPYRDQRVFHIFELLQQSPSDLDTQQEQ